MTNPARMRPPARIRPSRVLGCFAVAIVLMMGAASTASASDLTIKSLIKRYEPQIAATEGRVVNAVNEYKENGSPVQGNPAYVQAAIKEAAAVLRELKLRLSKQRAVAEHVKLGKAKLEKGLQAVIASYRHLTLAFGEAKVTPAEASVQATKAINAVNRGHKDLLEGLTLIAPRG
jgi:hypothetical protein